MEMQKRVRKMHMTIRDKDNAHVQFLEIDNTLRSFGFCLCGACGGKLGFLKYLKRNIVSRFPQIQ